MKKRKLDIVVLSDLHLGTYGCHARELNLYLKSISPKILILNGDIIDMWQFSKRYWPDSHTKVLQKIMKMIGKGVKVYYLTGNHDETLRKFVDFKMGSFQLLNKLVVNLENNKKAWFFHGDVFDVTMQYSKWLAKLGAIGYDTLIIINSFVNFILEKLGRPKISLSQKIKNGVKQAVKFINDFEETAITIAAEKGFDFVVCGHIHQPCIKEVITESGKKLTYLNSGDWIENLTSLEYKNNNWKIFNFKQDFIQSSESPKQKKLSEVSSEFSLDPERLILEIMESV